MTPEKKEADQIFTDFYIVLFDSESDKGEECLVSILAKNCALKCVDLILKANPTWFVDPIKSTHQFYEDVKSELKKL